jgi:anhydro-N-acetylmuramic acid kinase
MRVIGLMSGTSGDGVDAALVDIREGRDRLHVRQIAFQAVRYPRTLQQQILFAATRGSVADACRLHAVLGEWFARAALAVVKEAGLRAADVGLIGSHGQTIHHLPVPTRQPSIGPVRATLQIAAPAVIAERTGIDTIADFRARDVAAGGEGAPLAPYAHHLLFAERRLTRLIVNIGGISNVTYLPAGQPSEAVRAFDTGPGNMLLDLLAARLSGGRVRYDRGGRWAAQGTVDPALLAKLQAHPFLRRRPPKSTGREEFGDILLKDLLDTPRRPEDLLATCTRFTAVTIAGARRWLDGAIDEVIVGGGGSRNRTLMRHLAELFDPTPVTTFEALGWDSKAFEAVTFAVLAYQSLHGRPTNLPAVTGARRPVILGSFTPAGHRFGMRAARRGG